MLSFFRRMINSKVGIVVTFIVLGIIALAFAGTDISRVGGGGSTVGSGDVASVDGRKITTADLKQRANSAIESARQRDPTLTMASFLEQNGLESILEQITNSIALDKFGHDAGMAASKRSVDGQIAGIPGLQGPTGKFDPAIYQRLLAQRHLTDAQVRGDIASETIGQFLLAPVISARQVPEQLALPYASLLLEHRKGQIGFVPTRAFDDAKAPTDAEIADFYKRNVARYTLPERRVMRYAVVTPDMMGTKAVPTDADIAQAYKDSGNRYAATEHRSVTSVIVADQAGATAIAAKAKAGTGIADAAKAAGLESRQSKDLDKAGLAATTSQPLADAAFAATQGAVVGPIRTPLGWAVAKVDAVTAVPGKTLAQATTEIRDALAKTKLSAALSAARDSVDNALSSNGTFDEIVKDQKLSPMATPTLTAQGIDPEHPDQKLDPKLAPVVQAGFQAEEGDAPQIVPLGEDNSFALVGLARIVPAAPRPLAAIRDQVVADVRTDRSMKAARAVAKAVVAKVDKGAALAAAMNGAGKPLPPVRPIEATRAQLAANPRGAPPPLVLMFSMARGSAKMLEAPNNTGWFVIKLDDVTPGDARGKANVISAARSDIARTVGREYAQQFAKAMRDAVGVKTDPAAVAKVKADLAGGVAN
ncbi:peptidylprolyl isomerase [Sphingomonas oligophenolica]|uniref:Parvulin-like PPIase n=1 Tax=Sphingomonas oligophenolica TaxID=301154 RepID=A0A502CLX8_9SPHN|nr:peptidylprolyl isomerase [Sphingomonas oligophenolica]TPG12701.1 peptidylprolyl isomerase [Sphingomonas oligophenolica]